jgi:hypothetical protein
MAIEKVIEIKVDAKDAVKQLDNINNELLEQKKITIELERELAKLEQQLKDTPNNSLSAQKKLREQIDHVKTSLKDQRTSVRELGIQKQELTNTVKKLTSEEKEQNKELKNTGGVMGAIDNITGGLVSKFKGFTGGLKSVTQGFGALKGALIATGLGALAVLVGSLFEYFKNFEGGVKIVTTALNLFGDTMSAIVSNAHKLLTLDFAGFFGGVSDAMKESIELTDKLFKSEQKLFELNLKFTKENAELNKQIEEQGRIVRDTTKSFEERLKAQQQLDILTEKLLINERALTDEQLRNIRTQIGLENNYKKKKELQLEEQNIIAKLIELESRVQSQRDKASKSQRMIIEEQKQQQEELTKKHKEEAEKRAQIARGEVEKLRNIYQDYEKKIQDINAKSEEEKTALERKRAEVAIDQVETDETKKEIARQKVKEYYDIIEAERQTKLVEAERVKQEQIKAIEDEFSMRKAEQANLTEEERLAFELQKVEIEKQKKILELDNLKATEEQKLEVLSYYKQREDKLNDDFTKAEMARQKLVNKQKLDLTKSTFGALATILGENSKAGKLFASGQALINTWQGVTEVLSNKTTLPEPFGTINKVASTGAVIASGLKAVQQINSVKTLGGGGGGQSGGGASPQITPPSFNIVQGTGTNQIAESIANANQKPVKAYVVSTDVRTNESLERNIQKSSEF